MGGSSFGRLFTENTYNRVRNIQLGTSVTEGRPVSVTGSPSKIITSTRNDLLYTEKQGTLVRAYFSQQFANYHTHQTCYAIVTNLTIKDKSFE